MISALCARRWPAKLHAHISAASHPSFTLAGGAAAPIPRSELALKAQEHQSVIGPARATRTDRGQQSSSGLVQICTRALWAPLLARCPPARPLPAPNRPSQKVRNTPRQNFSDLNMSHELKIALCFMAVVLVLIGILIVMLT
ncbi:hypothetical protein ABIG06_006273 [Bradyrhizobium sp. USDA 326]|uniref:hypothetical protein n=1 Tax=unclassified Bradyrhizobium TaxID=2631580 RepID=UPI00351109BF